MGIILLDWNSSLFVSPAPKQNAKFSCTVWTLNILFIDIVEAENPQKTNYAIYQSKLYSLKDTIPRNGELITAQWWTMTESGVFSKQNILDFVWVWTCGLTWSKISPAATILPVIQYLKSGCTDAHYTTTKQYICYCCLTITIYSVYI